MHDDEDDGPSRDELEAEDAEDDARAATQLMWEESTKEGAALCRAEEEHPHMTKLIEALRAKRQAYVDDHWQETLAEAADADHEARDPLGYRGLSPGMFL